MAPGDAHLSSTQSTDLIEHLGLQVAAAAVFTALTALGHECKKEKRLEAESDVTTPSSL